MLRNLSLLKRSTRSNFFFGSARCMSYTTLPSDSNQAQGLAEYAIKFMNQDNSTIDEAVYDKTRLFHTDSVLCGISAIA